MAKQPPDVIAIAKRVMAALGPNGLGEDEAAELIAALMTSASSLRTQLTEFESECERRAIRAEAKVLELQAKLRATEDHMRVEMCRAMQAEKRVRELETGPANK